MKETYTDHFIDWYKFLQSHMAKRIGQDEEEIIEISKELQKICEEHKGEEKENFDDRQQAVFNCIEHLYNKRPSQIDLKLISADFFGERDFFLRKLPETETKEQPVNRFRKLEKDSRWLKFKKSFKILFFFISKTFFFIANLFRKEKKPLHYWNHTIKVKQLAQRNYINTFYKAWQEVEKERVKFFLEQIEKLKKQDFHHDKEIHEQYATLIASIHSQITDWYESNSNQFHEEFDIVNTIEFKDKWLTNDYLEKEEDEAIEAWKEEHRKWKNTLHASFEDWRSQLELSALKAYTNFQKEELLSSMQAWYHKLEGTYVVRIQSFLEECLGSFAEGELKSPELKKQISQLNYQTKKQLDQEILKEFESRLSENNLLNQLDRFEHLIDSRINELEDEHVVVKVQKFDRGLTDNELSEISNHELLSFEISPLIKQKTEQLKNELFKQIGELLVAVGDIDEIVTYVLNTAANAIDEEMEAHEVQNILKEGYERALNANEEIKLKLKETLQLAEDELSSIEQNLGNDIDELSKKENIAALKLRISKAKALRKSEALSKQLKDEFFKYFVKAKSFLLDNYALLYKEVQALNKRFLSINVTDQPHREVSDFLNESNKTISELPLIYRRLYAIEPLNDIVLFEGRKQEVKKFEQAYTAWNEGKYGDVIMTGEKWSGLTSLINYILKTVKFKHVYTRLRFEKTNVSAENMLQHFSEAFKTEAFEDNQALINYLNNGPRKIVIVEDIQNTYLRTMGGQKTIQELIEIIAATQQNIFWVVSISLYAYKYLDRTFKISAFFSYPIVMGTMDAETISQLIIKRNRISGFKINFEASEQMKSDKKYLKLADDQKQDYLRKKFFKELHAFSKSNVSMALMYWLLSTKSVDGHSIIIKNFEKPDFSFLNSLHSDRVFVLSALIMHDGLRSVEIAEVLNLHERKVQFYLIEMLEDGILIKEEQTYLVNPMIFKNVVQLLKDKNLLSQ